VDSILTFPGVAVLLKVAEKTVYTMEPKGQNPAFKVSSPWRFKHIDIDHWIDEQKISLEGKARKGGLDV
tara:strand:+ start:137 stop:343 length:207 start_codon:yes stop_codon:yes gene_type:complete